jgi:hypothetical protein
MLDIDAERRAEWRDEDKEFYAGQEEEEIDCEMENLEREYLMTRGV